MSEISQKFEQFLRQNLPSTSSFHPHYNDMLSAMLLAGGKHFRASLLLGVVDVLRPELTNDAMRVALGVELIHTYSLIHDDLPAMDDSPLRRGVDTLHIRYDEVSAILAGDALNTHAFYEISRSNFSAETRIKCVEILSQNAGVDGMVLGQALDCFYEASQKADKTRAKLGVSKQKLDIVELKFLHIHKTGKLIAASLEMGALLAGLNEQKCKQIYNIGLDLGLAFQIHDDIIDATAEQNTAGKPVGNDTAKNSFTNLLGINGAIEAKNELIQGIKTNIMQAEPSLFDMIFKLIQKHLA